MNFFIIIQARMTSTRLPKKVMLPLCEKSVLEVIFERLKIFQDHIIIATTDDGSEEDIISTCKKNEVKYFQGSTQNVLERYYKSAKYFGAKDSDIIVRITSDCPFIDADLVQEAINQQKIDSDSFVVVDIHSSFPRGLDAEVFRFSELKKAYINATSDYDKEHVTPYIKSSGIKRVEIKDDENSSKYRITLDEVADYEAIKELYKLLGCRYDFKYKELLKVLKNNPYIYEINKDIKQKKRV
jgi:spore coat polysaccharide biosynthesis protein SpsF